MCHELGDLRRRIEALATPDGTFRLACARTGERPVPAAGLRFETRPSAERAARLTSEYRERLRERDPRTPRYDVVVHEASFDETALFPRATRTPDSTRATSDAPNDGDPSRTYPGDAA